jgi:hypothetical protein
MKYLNHNLTEYSKYDHYHFDYTCVVCGIVLYKRNDYTYLLVEDDNVIDEFACTLTCEEYMIKSIIE